MMINMKRDFINYCGLLGIVAFFSYTAAVVFSPLAYPGYNWMAQAVSDLSAANAPSLRLWNQLSSLYSVCTLVCALMVCAGIQGRGSRTLRLGIYLMEWVSAVGFSMFPLSDSGYAGTFQDQMNIFSTIIVVLLSILSLVLIMIAGIKDKAYRLYGVFAGIALGMMLVVQLFRMKPI